LVARFERDGDGRPQYRGIVQDVTERRLSEQALSRVRSELAHVTRVTSLNALTASIAHEVNQPLSGIITNASTCLRKLAADPPDIEGARLTVQRTIRDGNRAHDVIARLRALFSKKDATIESVDLNEAAREVISLSLDELRHKEISVRLELHDELPVVAGDRVQLQQVILNLTLNASDSMCAVADRPRQLRIVTGLDENGHVQLAVSDTGVGLDGGSIVNLFEAFYTTKPGGMGIGLSVSRSIIESHHGRLWAKPNEGPGATFLFSIPIAGEAGAT
jgi:signal transduction histidine kinase